MALSGTTLTVTTLTTAGLLTNNVSGQVSSVTGTSLASLLGGAPTFTGLTLSGLGSGLLKVTSGVVGVATGGDYQAPMSGGTNITITNDTVITISTTPVFTGMTLSGGTLANTMLKTIAGVISQATVNNDYQAALTAGSNLILTTNNTVINTIANPTFAGINCSSIGTNNTLLGTFAGGNLISTGLGTNTLCGFQAGVNITSGTYNTCIGNNTGTNCISGTNCVYIGNSANTSGSAISNEGVINLSGSLVSGKGTNTMLINSSSGLYSYLPCFWWGYAQNQTGGIIRWNTFSPTRSIAINPNDSTQLILPFIGVYELTLSGSVNVGAGSQAITMFLNGGRFIGEPCFFQTTTGWTSASLNVFVNVVGANTYIQYDLTSSLSTAASHPLILTAKFISL